MKKVSSFLREWGAILIKICGAALIYGICCAALIYGVSVLSDLPPELWGAYEVVSVIDGDTIDVDIDGEAVRVRLLGVDTPESVHPDESRNTDEGKAAADWMRAKLVGEKVYLEYDIQQMDKYGRTLAYVYLDDRETMVNRLMLENGLAQIMTVQPNSKYADEFYKLQLAARKAGAGFWAEAWS